MIAQITENRKRNLTIQTKIINSQLVGSDYVGHDFISLTFTKMLHPRCFLSFLKFPFNFLENKYIEENDILNTNPNAICCNSQLDISYKNRVIMCDMISATLLVPSFTKMLVRTR